MDFQWSEVFKSIQGEGPFSGHPTIFVRFVGCNFQCKSFNNTKGLEATNENLGFNPGDCKSLAEIPPITFGCDSRYSWDKRFCKLWHNESEEELAKLIHAHLQDGHWQHAFSGLPHILSFTGGEPVLQSKKWPSLLATNYLKDLKILLIETNGAVQVHKKALEYLDYWENQKEDRMIIWSVSPKLSNSGELAVLRIRPDITFEMLSLTNADQYFKFVCGPHRADFDEVAATMNIYRKYYYENGIDLGPSVFVMPMACTKEQQDEISAKVAKLCLEYGFIYCHRIQNSVFNNAIGT
jgi:organic radical activating enzyme